MVCKEEVYVVFKTAEFACRDGGKSRKSLINLTNLQPDILTGNLSNMMQISNGRSATFHLMELNSVLDFSEKRGEFNN
jgi:hypothetical protein